MKKLILALFLVMGISFPCSASDRTYVFLKTVLDNMNEYWQHHIGVEKGFYEIYTSPNGKDEAVYYSHSGLLQKDDLRNIGTYNCYPYKMGTKHFLVDAYAWLMFGNTAEDTSYPEDRWEAWQKDFFDAFNKVCYNDPKLFDRRKNLLIEKEYDAFLEAIFEPLLKDKELGQLLKNSSSICAYEDGNIEKSITLLKQSLKRVFEEKLSNKEIYNMCNPLIEERLKCMDEWKK